jgi:hypothetical protein
MTVEKLKKGGEESKGRLHSETRFPGYSLADSVHVAKVIYERGGGSASPEHLASYLEYKSTSNGAYLSRVGAARVFGLIAKSGNLLVPTPLAHRILSPVYPEDAKKALVEAFLNVDLFKRVYEDFKGRELPPEFGLKNALRNQYGVVSGRVDTALRSLQESAETAGFFETRMGARTHLILPQIQSMSPRPPAPSPEDGRQRDDGGGGGNDGGGGSGDPPPPAGQPPSSKTLNDVKAEYVSMLIKTLEGRSKDGEMDEKLMERIERLLGVQK